MKVLATFEQHPAGWLLLLTLIACATVPAMAQGDLAITASTSVSGETGCSKYSPQFNNEIQSPANHWPFTDFHRAPTIPIDCITTAMIWVMNIGPVPTVNGATVIVTYALTPDQPKDNTILTANGFCAWENTDSISGKIWCLGDSRDFGAPANKIADNGWNCMVTQGKLACTRSDVLAPGETFPPITVKSIREDYSPLTFNEQATVSGGGFIDIDPTNNSHQYQTYLFEGIDLFHERFIVNSVPNRRIVRVDGIYYQTPHAFIVDRSSIHTIEGEDNPKLDHVCFAPIPGTGTPFTGNPGYTVVGYSNGFSTRAGTSGVGCANPTSFTSPEFIVGSSTGFVSTYVTVLFQNKSGSFPPN